MSLVLAFSILMGTATSFASNSPAQNAKSRVEAYINLGSKGKEITAEDMQGMTQDELQFLGVYLSNFFVPFRTEVGESRGAYKSNEGLSNELLETLKNTLGFEETLAKTLSEGLLSISRQTYTRLKAGFASSITPAASEITDRITFEGFGNSNKNEYMASGTYGEFLSMLFGDNIAESRQSGLAPIYKDLAESHKYLVYYRENDPNKTPVFSISLEGEPTPAQYAFMRGLDPDEFLKGHGSAIFNITQEEYADLEKEKVEGDEKPMDVYLKKMKNTKGATVFTTEIGIDAFGNLITNGANHQFIIMQGAMNPYIWQKVDSSGNDLRLQPAGSVFNIANMITLSDIVNNRFATRVGTTTMGLAPTASSDLNASTGRTSYSFSNSKGILPIPNGLPMAIGDTKTHEEWFKLLNIFKLGTNQSQIGLIESEKELGKGVLDYGLHYVDKGQVFSKITSSQRHMSPNSKKMVKENGRIYLKGPSEMPYMSGFAFIDDLQAFNWGQSTRSDVKMELINFLELLKPGSISLVKEAESIKSELSSEEARFTSQLEKVSEGGVINQGADKIKKLAASLYVTYAYAGLYKFGGISKKDSIGRVGYRLYWEALPEIGNAKLEISAEIQEDMITKDIKSWTYAFLHPSDFIEYTTQWLKNKVGGFILGFYRDLTGTKGVGNQTGTTKYRSNVSFATVPEVNETEWTAKLISYHSTILILVLVLIIVVFAIRNTLGTENVGNNIKYALIGMISVILMPTILIFTLSTTNTISSIPISDSYSFWAVTQHQMYSNAIDNAITSDTYTGYLRELTSANLGRNQGGDPVNVRWQAPKKMASIVMNGVQEDLGTNAISKSIQKMLNRNYSGETYLNNSESNYLYRSYLDLGNVSRFMYGSMDHGKFYVGQDGGWSTANWDDGIKQSVSTFKDDTSKLVEKGFQNESARLLRLSSFLNARPYTDALSMRGKLNNLTLNDFVGLDMSAFNFSLPLYTSTNSDTRREEIIRNDMYGGTTFLKEYEDKGYSVSEIGSLGVYGVMSESPYYYFSFKMYDDGLSSKPGATDGFKSVLLTKPNAGYFINNSGNDGSGEVKDFLDMRGLFTYVIPYLKQGNDLVKEWDNLYGIRLYEGVPFEQSSLDTLKADPNSSEELIQKTWHNINVARLYSMYSPWVDLIYSADYANPEDVEVLGEKFTVTDPLNPASYPEERPMIFSRSEAKSMGYKDYDLTKVEKKILELNDILQEKFYKLLDYYSFNDSVLNNAAAMESTFAFNRVFSQSGFLKETIELFPISYELADFSSDALIRQALKTSINTKGFEVDSGDEDFYETVVSNSHMGTAIMLIITGIVFQYVLPTMKILIVLMLIVGMYIMVVESVTNQRRSYIKSLLNKWLSPLVKFALYTWAFSFIMLKFTDNGGKVTESDLVLRFGDPFLVLVLMTIAAGVVTFLYFKLIVDLFKTIKSAGAVVGGFLWAGMQTTWGTISEKMGLGNPYGANRSPMNRYSPEGATESAYKRSSSSRGSSGSKGKSDGLDRDRISVSRKAKGGRVVKPSPNSAESRRKLDSKISKGAKKLSKSNPIKMGKPKKGKLGSK